MLSHFRPGEDWRKALLTGGSEQILDQIEDGLGWLAAFAGLVGNLARNYGWSFLEMGHRIERAFNLSEAILSLFGAPLEREEETGQLLFLLELADSFITYRSRYRLDPMLPLVLDLLLLDESNPRSLAYQLVGILGHLAALPQSQQGAGSDRGAPSHPFAADRGAARRRRSLRGRSDAARAARRHGRAAPPAAAARDGDRAALFQSYRRAAAPGASAVRAEAMTCGP